VTPGAIPLRELAALIDGGHSVELQRRAEEILRQHPGSGPMWKALGVALTLQGVDSAAAWARAAALLPADAQAHHNLGDAWLRLGNHVDAETAYRRALALAPGAAAVHNNLGNVLLALGRPLDAVASYRSALALEPHFAVAFNNLGNALRHCGRVDEAIASYRQALEENPGYAEACNNLGNACLDAGRPEEAQACYRQAVALNPRFAEAHNNLGTTWRNLGRFGQAVACYARAVELNAGLAEPHVNLSDALRDQGRPYEAAAAARRALDLNPGLAGAHNSLGNALLDLGRPDDAAASYRRALEVRPAFAEAAVNLGTVLRLSGDAAGAEGCCRRLLEARPDAAAALIVLGELRSDAGHFADAEALFERAATIDPGSAEACAAIPHLRKMTVNDTAWLERAERIGAQRPLPRQEVHLRYALGKYFDDTGDYRRAFGHYRRANELQRTYGERFDRGRLSASVDRTIAEYDGQWARRAGYAGQEGEPAVGDPARSVFIVGMPRSGTTLAEQILASHPDIVGAGELPFWSTAPADGTALQLGFDYLQLLRRLSPNALRVLDKMPANVWSLAAIHEALPQARIIHMQRHPFDTCLSVYFQHFKNGHSYANDLGDLAHYHREYRRLVAHWREVLPAGTMLEVPYEGLVEDPEGWTRSMLDFIGMPWDPRCLNFHESDRSVMTASKWQVRQKISRSSVARWRNYQEFLDPLDGLSPPDGPGP
jgi:tetratricopeptide (TPR) repeat protein